MRVQTPASSISQRVRVSHRDRLGNLQVDVVIVREGSDRRAARATRPPARSGAVFTEERHPAAQGRRRFRAPSVRASPPSAMRGGLREEVPMAKRLAGGHRTRASPRSQRAPHRPTAPQGLEDRRGKSSRLASRPKNRASRSVWEPSARGASESLFERDVGGAVNEEPRKHNARDARLVLQTKSGHGTHSRQRRWVQDPLGYCSAMARCA